MGEIIQYAIPNSTKKLRLMHGNVSELPEKVDLLVCSAFVGDYVPTRSSLIGMLYWEHGISVEKLSQKPEIDIRTLGVWMSRELEHPLCRRIGCVELMDYTVPGEVLPAQMESRMRSVYDTLLFCIRKAVQQGIPIRTVAMPVFGTGNQGINLELSLRYLLTECVNALTTIPGLEEITIFNRDLARFERCERFLNAELNRLNYQMAFISYSHRDVLVANVLANLLEERGVKPWIDHRMIRDEDYAKEIVEGMAQSQTFLLLVSRYSMASNDVLREVRNASVLADQGKLRICPVMLEKIAYPASFSYYLTGLDWTDVSQEPRQPKLEAICDRLVAR